VKPTRPEIPKELVAAHKRRRIIDAVTELTAEQGYEATKIADVVRRAGVARETLYDNFAGKEAVFLAAVDDAVSEAIGRVEDACGAVAADQASWQAQIEAGVVALLTAIAARPAAAHVWMVEAISASPAASVRYDEMLGQFVLLMRSSAPRDTDLPSTVEETLVGGVAWILYQQIRRGKASQALELSTPLCEFLLFPYHGVGAGRMEAQGESDSTVADSSR
jgi:AcrR family transcriptional regulator